MQFTLTALLLAGNELSSKWTVLRQVVIRNGCYPVSLLLKSLSSNNVISYSLRRESIH